MVRSHASECTARIPEKPLPQGPAAGEAADAPATILVALDGSTFAESGLGHARALARALGGRLHLVTVLDPGRTGGTAGNSAEFRLQLIETERYLEWLARELREEAIEASLEVREGNPAHEIQDAALEWSAGLVVVAARPRGCEERVVSRGVAREVIASGVASLLVARGDRDGGVRPGGAATYRRIAVAVDGSPASHRALRLAESVARWAGARLVLVHVLQRSPGSPRDVGPGDAREKGKVPDGEGRSDGSGLSAAGSYLQRLGRRLTSRGTRVTTVLCRSSRVADTVEEAAREAGADLLVVGARGAGGAGSRYGGCALRLLLHGVMPVLVVRGGERKTSGLGVRGALRRPRPRRHIRGGRRDEAPATFGATKLPTEERTTA